MTPEEVLLILTQTRFHMLTNISSSNPYLSWKPENGIPFKKVRSIIEEIITENGGEATVDMESITITVDTEFGEIKFVPIEGRFQC